MAFNCRIVLENSLNCLALSFLGIWYGCFTLLSVNSLLQVVIPWITFVYTRCATHLCQCRTLCIVRVNSGGSVAYCARVISALRIMFIVPHIGHLLLRIRGGPACCPGLSRPDSGFQLLRSLGTCCAMALLKSFLPPTLRRPSRFLRHLCPFWINQNARNPFGSYHCICFTNRSHRQATTYVTSRPHCRLAGHLYLA